MVIAWIPVDDFEGRIAMDAHKGTHTEYTKRHESWDPYDYCSVEENIKSKCNNEEFEKHRIDVKPGDVAFLQGLTFHEVTRSCGCTLLTCRRITLRYVDAAVTRWRDDIPPLEFPFVRMLADRGNLVNKSLPLVYDRNNPINYNGFDSDGPILPSMFEWMLYTWHVIKNGFHESENTVYDMLFRCPRHPDCTHPDSTFSRRREEVDNRH